MCVARVEVLFIVFAWNLRVNFLSTTYSPD